MDKFTKVACRFLWFGICIFAIFAMLYGTFKRLPKETIESKFEVVDTYKNCEVVRWTDLSQRWRYFLDCSGSSN